MQVLLPGDPIPSTSRAVHTSIKLGPGVYQLPATATSSSSEKPALPPNLSAVRAGLLGVQSTPSTATREGVESYWVESQSKRYVPAAGEPVIGVIIARHAEGYRVDIGSAHMAALDALAFEDATKRNKPNLKVGTVVYARVSLALPFVEPEIECFDPKTGKSQGFGELAGGFLLRHLELGKCRALLFALRLLNPSHPLLPSIGQKFPFELAIGVNGRVWVKATEVERTLQLVKAIRDA